MSEKITGYLLLVLGIIFIVIPAFSVYQVCTGQTKAYQFFKLSGISIDIGSQLADSQQKLNLSPEILKALTSTTPSKPVEIIPAALLNDSSNIFIHIMLMGFIASVGQKVAGLGVQLIRPVVVKLNSKDNAI